MEDTLVKIAIMLVPGLMAITFHEVAHGYIAYKFGDNTAKYMGRLTLNPIKHLSVIGTILIFLIGIGWAKPVPVNFNNLKNPKRDMIWVGVAGPVTNLILATLSALLIRVLVPATEYLNSETWVQMFINPFLLMLGFSVYINVLLALFNMIPLPPLDGGRVLVGLLPYRQAEALSRIEPFGIFIIIFLVFFLNIFQYLAPVINMIIQILTGPHSQLVYSVTDILMRKGY